MSSRCEGVSIVEALVALVLGILVLQLSLGVLARERRAQRRLREHAEAMGAVRIARHVLEAELRRGRAGRDWSVVGRDSLVLRAFRGVGLVCPWRPGAKTILVSYRGVRSPDPAKDSVLFLGDDGAWMSRALVSAAGSASPCPEAPDIAVQRWTLDRDTPAGVVLARVFERGSYHLSGGAFRYRRGAAGRQPLTPAVLRTPPSAFVLGDGTVALSVTTGEGPRASPSVWRILLWRRPDDSLPR